MCRLSKTIPQVTAITLTSMLLFCQQAGARQDEPKSTSLGYESGAYGMGAVAIGWATEARGDGSIAIGSKTSLIGGRKTRAENGGIAIGMGSVSRSAGDVNFGSRKLSGLLDGIRDDEAVTMRQMKAAQAHTENVKNDLLRAIDSAGTPVLSEARNYSDLAKTQAIAAANTYSDNARNEAIAVANAYSDAVKQDILAQGITYTEKIIATTRVQHDTTLLSQAKSYADEESGKALETAQLYSEDVGRVVLTSANAFTDMRSQQAQDNAVALSRQYTDRRVNQLQSQINQFRRRAHAGISGAMAMTTLTPPPANANTSFGVAMATYRSQIALASGVSFRTGKDSNVRLNTSWDSAGGIGAAAGFNVAW